MSSFPVRVPALGCPSTDSDMRVLALGRLAGVTL